MNPNQGNKRSAATHRLDGLVVANPASDRDAAQLAKALSALSTVLLVLAVALLVLNRELAFKALSPHRLLVPDFAPALALLSAAVPRRPGAVPPLAGRTLAAGGGRCRRHRLGDAAAGPN
jgi:hypothetical protein